MPTGENPGYAVSPPLVLVGVLIQQAVPNPGRLPSTQAREHGDARVIRGTAVDSVLFARDVDKDLLREVAEFAPGDIVPK